MDRTTWLILTGEYPPTPGGVADYTRQVAAGLANAGYSTHVFAPHISQADAEATPGVTLHRLCDHFGKAGLVQLEAAIAQIPTPRRILVQYVPHTWGVRAMNLRFARWVKRIGKSESVDLMFHEVAYPIEAGQPFRHRILAYVNRWMARTVCASAERLFVSIPGWEDLLHEIGVKKNITWAPVPSNIDLHPFSDGVADLAQSFGDATVIAHFGTYHDLIATRLKQVVPQLAGAHKNRAFLFLGRGSKEFADQLGDIGSKVVATGPLESKTLAVYLAAADVMLQPYPDGISCRRSSVMASLALGVPVITNHGHLTESFWADSGAVALAESPAVDDFVRVASAVLDQPQTLQRLGEAGRALYLERFQLSRTLEKLRI